MGQPRSPSRIGAWTWLHIIFPVRTWTREETPTKTHSMAPEVWNEFMVFMFFCTSKKSVSRLPRRLPIIDQDSPVCHRNSSKMSRNLSTRRNSHWNSKCHGQVRCFCWGICIAINNRENGNESWRIGIKHGIHGTNVVWSSMRSWEPLYNEKNKMQPTNPNAVT